MKAAVIGYGNVGMAVFRELQDVHKLTELTLVGRNIEKVNDPCLKTRACK